MNLNKTKEKGVAESERPRLSKALNILLILVGLGLIGFVLLSYFAVPTRPQDGNLTEIEKREMQIIKESLKSKNKLE